MGRKKISIARIEDGKNRQVTFVKRKKGLMKKARELAVLCECHIEVVIFNGNGQLYEFSSEDPEKIFSRYEGYTGTAEMWNLETADKGQKIDIDIPQQLPNVSKAAAKASISAAYHKPTTKNTRAFGGVAKKEQEEEEEDTSDSNGEEEEEKAGERPPAAQPAHHNQPTQPPQPPQPIIPKADSSIHALTTPSNRPKEPAPLLNLSQTRQNSLPSVSSSLANINVSFAQRFGRVGRLGECSGFGGSKPIQPLSARGSDSGSMDCNAKYKRGDLTIMIPEKSTDTPSGSWPVFSSRPGDTTPTIQWQKTWTPTASMTARGDNAPLGHMPGFGGEYPEMLGLNAHTPAALTSAQLPIPSPSGPLVGMTSRATPSGSILGKRMAEGFAGTPMGPRHRLI